MLHYETIIPETKKVLLELMKQPELKKYRLAGGTALSLIKGHRKSDDIDLFIANYDPLGKPLIKRALKRAFPDPSTLKFSDNLSFGIVAYYTYNKENDSIKIDILNWDSEEFINPINEVDGVRLTSLEDLAAMKLNAAEDRKVKKDFIDIYELLKDFSLKDMIGFYKKRFLYNDEKSAIFAISQIDKADSSNMPKMLNNVSWEEVKENIKENYREFITTELKVKKSASIIDEILNPKKNKDKGNNFGISI